MPLTRTHPRPLATEPYKTKSYNPFENTKNLDCTWLVNGLYDELAAEKRTAIINAEILKDRLYAGNQARIAIEKHKEQRALELETKEYR
jgi:hypothetical protein